MLGGAARDSTRQRQNQTPILPGDAMQISLYDERPRNLGQPEDIPCGTILIVDGYDDFRRMVARQLSSLGYDVLEVDAGSPALRLLASNRPIDLLLTSIMMGSGMNGFELAKQARRQRPGLKVIYMSGLPANSQKIAKVDPGSALLSKPFRKADLDHLVRHALSS